MNEEIKKIVELDIDVEGMSFEDMGVEVVSFVTEPAIEIDFEYFSKEAFGDDTSNLPLYVDEDEDLVTKQNIILDWAKENGELITDEYTVLSLDQEFSTISEVTTAIQGLDILGKLGVRSNEEPEIKYRYMGPRDSGNRNFCSGMLSLNKMYTRKEIEMVESKLSLLNPHMGEGGSNSYDLFSWKGGVNCRHFWGQVAVYRPEGSRRVLVIDKGAASGNAGKSNNSDWVGPNGAVRNNARVNMNQQFSILDDEKRLAAGPLMVPNQFILRRGFNDEPYYVYFTKDTIKKIQEKFNATHKHNNTDSQHDGNIMQDNILMEQWIIEHPAYDKSKYYGFHHLPMGTWFGVYKVLNNDTWERIKSGELKGFSVAGNFIEKSNENVITEDEKTLSAIIKILKEVK